VTEVEMLAGTVCRMGGELGIPTPVNDLFYHSLKVLEEKNSGLIKIN
jgi:2-dehydropantoate 2-reductase